MRDSELEQALRQVSLTARQREIFGLLGEGRSCAEISRILGLARSTVTLHRRNLMRRLGITERSSLLRIAVLARSQRMGERGAIEA